MAYDHLLYDLANAAALVLGAVGFRLILSTTGVLNFAHGWCVVLGAALTVTFADSFDPPDELIGPAGAVAAVACAVLAMAVFGALFELTGLRLGGRQPAALQSLATLAFVAVIPEAIAAAGFWRDWDGDRFLPDPTLGVLADAGVAVLAVGVVVVVAAAVGLARWIERASPVGLVRTAAVATGTALAGLAGAVLLTVPQDGTLNEVEAGYGLVFAALIALFAAGGTVWRVTGVALGVSVLWSLAAWQDFADDSEVWTTGLLVALAVAAIGWLALRGPRPQVFNVALGVPRPRFVAALALAALIGGAVAIYVGDDYFSYSAGFWLPGEAARIASFALAAAALHYLFKTTGALAFSHVFVFGASGLAASALVVALGVPLLLAAPLVLAAALAAGLGLGWLFRRLETAEVALIGVVLTWLLLPFAEGDGFEIGLPETWWAVMPVAVTLIAAALIAVLWFRPERWLPALPPATAAVTIAAGVMSAAGILFACSASNGQAEHGEVAIGFEMLGALAEGGVRSWLGPVIGAVVQVTNGWAVLANPGLGLASALGNGLLILLFTLMIPHGLAGKIERLAGDDSLGTSFPTDDEVDVDLDVDVDV